MRQSKLLKRIGKRLSLIKEKFINASCFRLNTKPLAISRLLTTHKKIQALNKQIWRILGILTALSSTLFCLWALVHFIFSELVYKEIFHVLMLGTATGLRVLILICLSSLIWIPVGVWVGLRPKLAQKIQPIIQFAAAFPANLFYPLFVIFIVRFQLNVEIWVTPLMILGTQWYILFNVIAGASTIPHELYLAANNFGLKGWLWWKRLALPGIFPFFITGAITAAGGAWNASIVAEWVSWGNITLKATGLGEYIQAGTLSGDFPRIALGTVVMCLYVLAFNHIIWRPLYRLAQQRFTIY
jgi:NitT/TauT family transport system permease protein